MIQGNFFKAYKSVIFVKFNSSECTGELPTVHSFYAKALTNNGTLSANIDPLLIPSLSSKTHTLIVSDDFGHAMRCYLSLGWQLATNLIDIAVELKNLNNGLEYTGHKSPNTSIESRFQSICRHLDLTYALKRGSYLKTSALIEQNGIPFDTYMLAQIRNNREIIKKTLIEEHDEYHIYVNGVFSINRFAHFLEQHDISWPQLNGQLILEKDVFEERALSFPQLIPLQQLRKKLSKLNYFNLPVGTDAKNRCQLKPFASKTGRNQPSNSDFIFGQAAWLRGLIKPSKGFGIAYIDYSQQEFGIAAALSGDIIMQKAYLTGDPYLAFAKQAGAAPDNATKLTHKDTRDQFKACTLAVQYGMSASSFSNIINQQLVVAERLIKLHKSTYKDFWSWSDDIVSYAMTHNSLQTVYDWRVNFDSPPNHRFLRNYPMQANGAEMIRLACCMLVNEGIKVCAPVHDAVLIEAPLCELESTIHQAQKIMAEASSIILNGFSLNTDVDVVRYPNRFEDPRGLQLWNLVKETLTNNKKPKLSPINQTKRFTHA